LPKQEGQQQKKYTKEFLPFVKFSTLATHLSHYWKSDLLKKKVFKGRIVYSLSARGLERYRYFKSIKFKEVST